MKILVINGPNINMLGIREKNIYGTKSYKELKKEIIDYCCKMGIEVEIYQSNHEGDLVDKIQDAYNIFDGIVINPAAYTHTSIAIADALRSVSLPAVEVHISDINCREEFRKINYVSSACVYSVVGHGTKGYTEAVAYLAENYRK